MNSMSLDYHNKGKALHKYFEEHALKTPHKKAVEHDEGSITFGELNSKANQLARILKENGLSSDDIVAVAIERSIHMIIAVLAILKSGGGYLPINIDYPKERNQLIIANSKAKLLIYSHTNYYGNCNVRCLDMSPPLLNRESTNLDLDISTGNTACVIYTSGSTGLPKGAMLSHSSFINTLSWAVEECGFSEQDHVFNKSAVNFDASTFEIFLHFFTGAKLCLCKQGQEGNAEYLMRAIEKQKITVCVMVSSLLNVFLDYVEHKNCIDKLKTLKVIFSGGDKLHYPIVKKFNELLYERYHTRLYNLYGPAEITICCTAFECTNYQNEIVPVGKPIANTNVYILDENMDHCQENQAGEIYVSGPGVGKAYIDDEELTQKRFLEDKFINGKIMYRTGDLGKRNHDGNIEFLGRIDNQIKIRGNRVELEEIESVMMQYNNIAQAIVSCIEESKVLIAFYKSKNIVPEAELRHYLLEKVPDYMVPTHLVQVDSFPLGNSGKIDRQAVLDSYVSNAALLAAPPMNEGAQQSHKTLQIIKDIVDPNIANLITLDKEVQSAGIDSITFINIIVAIESKLNFEFDEEMLSFEAFPTIKSIVDYVESKRF